MMELATRFARLAREIGRAGAEEARIALLVESDVDPATLTDLFSHGDNEERRAILRALPRLRDPARFLPLAIEACRSSVVPVFEAIACDNPLPTAHFPDANFNQMVLKAVFVGVPLARVVGLQTRLSPELSRMARDYGAERRAAGRAIPDDLAIISGDDA
jgi:hypothetical protein